MNYAIFRSEPIYTLNDLAQLGSHNKREKSSYKSNPNIRKELSSENIELVPLTEKYVKGFYNKTLDYRKEHEEKMKKERKERQKTFNQMVNLSRNVVADELLFTATPKFFKDMSKEEIKRWANTCMDFVYNDLGYKKEQVLHATVHMDEDTPHIHCVVIPLVKKLDKRTNTERYTISKKQFIKDKLHLSVLQDKYCERLNANGFRLERGIKSDAKHQKVKDFKKTTRYYENKVEVINKNLDNAMNDFEEKMKTTKNSFIDKDYVKVKKETFESMNKVIDETRKAIQFQPKINELFNEVQTFTKSHQTLEKENKSMEKEISKLKSRNQELVEENNSLKSILNYILDKVKEFFRNLLKIGNKETQEEVVEQVKLYYDNKDFNSDDVFDIATRTEKEDELFDYANVPSYLKSRRSYNKDDRDKDDYEMSL